MKKSLFQKVLCFTLSVAILFSAVAVLASAARLKEESSTATLEEMQSLVGTSSYSEYIADYIAENPGSEVKDIDNATAIDPENGVDWVSSSKECQNSMANDQSLWGNYLEKASSTDIYLSSSSKATWSFNLTEEQIGLYYLEIVYYSCFTAQSSTSSIERKLFIDGNLPFSEAGSLVLSKTWAYEDMVGEPVVTDTTDPDSYDVEYKHIKTGKESEGETAGYYKIVTSVKDGKKTVTTYRIGQDINGNSMAPIVNQVPAWNTYYCHDNTGYYNGYEVENEATGETSYYNYFCFYFLNGDHTITLEAVRDPMIVSSIRLVPINDEENAGGATLRTYDEMKAYWQQKYGANYKPADTKPLIIQAEFPSLVSDSSVYATNDNSSAITYPSVAKSQLYNVIGENSYNTVGQWAAYTFTVDASGLYKIGMRYKQQALQGMYVCRAVKISGGDYGDTPIVPYVEAYSAQFDYNKKWQSDFISNGVDEQGNANPDFEFYFEEGVEYTLYLECSLGSLKELIQRVENSLNTINDCYLKILQLTGSDPDEYRDYNFLDIMPEVLYELLVQAMELEAVKAEFEALCGTAGSHTATLETVAVLLDKMGTDDGYNVAANMSTLKSYLGTLGTWVNNSKTSSMIVDSIAICPSDTSEKELPKAKAGFFKSIGFEIQSFFYSFIVDYDLMGLTEQPDENTTTIDVWLATGRDQSQIWRTMLDADDGFTNSTGVAVTLKLVTGGTLLPSILSGKGPDIYMGLGAADVINYAIRDAVLCVNGYEPRFDDATNDKFLHNYYTYHNSDGSYTTLIEGEKYTGDGELTFTTYSFANVIGDTDGDGRVDDEVDPIAGKKPNFAQAALDTITLEGKTYGIPQTMGFAMMFYRMDIFANIGEEIPETWDDMLSILPVLQSNNMSIGVSYISAIDFMIYQMGGNMWKYTDNPKYAGSKVDLDSITSLEAFDYMCRLYTDYSFPVSYDAANRFRTGEMPIIVGDYASIYNQLVVYATEISGLWEFTSLPGCAHKDEEGNVTVNYDSLAGIGATVMLNGCDRPFEAWQFLQWQTSAKIQANYGNKMVALIGPSAKYESANLHALDNLSWTASEIDAINDQLNHLSSIVNYPGSYIINRYMKFAFLAAVNDGADPTDALTGYIDDINYEIERKRIEFGLAIGDPEQ